MPRSRSLAVRMVLVTVLTPVIAVGLLGLVFVFTPGRWMFGLILGLLIGAVAGTFKVIKAADDEAYVLLEREDPELFAVLDRLCALADIPRPSVILSDQAQPNSWVIHFPGRPPRLHVTRALREMLTIEELQAVLGHELAHIANRDARVMTVVGLPAAFMKQARAAGSLVIVFVWAIGALSTLGVSMLSRYRELTADAGSAVITGRPSALASALLKVSDSLGRIPQEDLRAASALNAFNLVATPSRHWLARRLPRITSTHPPVQARIDALARLEEAQQLPRL